VKTKLARQIRADKVLTARVKKPEMPSEKEMKEFWESHKKEFPVNDSLRALQIVLLTGDKSSNDLVEKKRATLESIRRELLRDSTKTSVLLQRFMSVAAQVSEGPEGKSGGDLQRFNPKDFNAEFRKQAQALQVGQLSPVFKTPLGYHLILLIEKYDGKFDSYKLQVVQNLVNQKTVIAGGEMRQFLKSLAVKYPVKFLVQGYKDSSEGGIY
jgi:parvulin-like peptidyl-prolyl isomerase